MSYSHLALLRGINVSGHKTVPMARLKALFVDGLGYADAKTHLNSGNVLFAADSAPRETLEKLISGELRDTFGFPVEVVVRTRPELVKIAERGPFAGTADDENITRYVTFFKTAPTQEQLSLVAAIDNPGETHVAEGSELFSELNRGLSQNLVFSGNFIDKKLKSIATTRNWRVVRKLAEMMA